MKRIAQYRLFGAVLTILAAFGSAGVWAQEPAPLPLGDLARSLRKEHQAVVPTVIDNDNLDKVMDEVATRRLEHSSLVFSFDGAAKTFQVSSPDVTCSLSFNAQATALISDPYLSRELPASELGKLDGPARIEGDNLQVAVFNGTTWRVDEITVGLTVVKRGEQAARFAGVARIVPASSETTTMEQKRPDVTTLYKMRAAAAPSKITVFRTDLSMPLGPDEEWHWAIVQAKGIPPRPGSLPESLAQDVPAPGEPGTGPPAQPASMAIPNADEKGGRPEPIQVPADDVKASAIHP